MLTIVSLAKRFESLNTDAIIADSLEETKDSFAELNKQQMRAGKTKTGDKIGSTTNPNNQTSNYYKWKKYAAAKNDMNPLPGLGNPDLFLTGSFYDGIDVEIGSNVFDIISTDEKGPELEDKYPDILGLGSNFKKEYLDELKPVVMDKISNFTGLKFR